MLITEINRCNIVNKKCNSLKKSKTQIVNISSPYVTSYLCRLLKQTEATDIPFTFKTTLKGIFGLRERWSSERDAVFLHCFCGYRNLFSNQGFRTFIKINHYLVWFLNIILIEVQHVIYGMVILYHPFVPTLLFNNW